MAFLIPDNLKSRKDVPEGVRRVAAAIQMGLDETATLWFEPLFDPSRQKPHFVLLLPDRGIIVMELLEMKSSSGFLGVVRKNVRLLRDGKEVEVENPLERAKRFAKVLQERLAAEPRVRDLSIPVASGAIFHLVPQADAEPKGLSDIIDLEVCLFREQIESALTGSGEAELQRAFARMLGGSYRDRVDADTEKVLRGIIQPEAVIDREQTGGREQLVIFRPPSGDSDAIRVMDRHQEAMAKSLGDGHRIIRGVAGSGKTLVLVYRARLLSQLYPREQILVTCYTRSLAGQLKAILVDCSNVTVRHLDGLMADYLRKAKRRNPGYEDDPSGEEVAKAALDALGNVRTPRYRAVLLDEAQDFANTALRFALGLLESGSEDFILVADAAQNIFRRKFSWKSVGIQAQGRTRILRRNYRNTREILESAYQFLLAGGDIRADDAPSEDDENAVIPPEVAVRRGPQPSLTLCASETIEEQTILNRVRAWLKNESSPRSIAVVYATNDGRPFRLMQKLRSAGVPTFWLTDPKDRTARDRLSATDCPVILTTIHGAKGLEFPRVVLMGPPKEGEDSSDYRRLAYVGMTRATEELEVIVPSTHPYIDDFSSAFGQRSA